MNLTPEVRRLCEEVRRFVQKEVDPRARWIEEHDAIPEELVRMAREMGLFGITIPEQYGGVGLDLSGKCAVEEEMGRTSYAFATFLGNHTGIGTAGIVALGSEAQKKKYLPRMASGEWIGCFALTEPQAGSDPAAMRASAVRKGDRYVLNGEKIFITNGGVAQLFTVMAITDRAKGIKGISAFIVERGSKGFVIGKNEHKMGMHGVSTVPLAFNDCEVPADNLLGPEGMGYVQALKTLTMGRVTIAARCCGMMDRLIERCVEYMKTRVQGGKKLAEHQGLQWMLADMGVQRDAARLLTWRANQLNKTPNNSLNNVISGVPIESQVLKFAANNYTLEIYDGSAWIKSDGSPGTMSASPGEGIFFFNPEGNNVTVTLVGEVPQGTGLTVALPPGFALVSSIVPQAIPLTPANGFPNVTEMQFLYFNAATQTYDPPVYNDGTGWITPDGTPTTPPTPPVGTGFFIFNPGAATVNWTRNFSVN